MLEIPFLELEGVRIPNDPEVITPQIARAIRAGRYEKDERRGLPKFLGEEDRVVELGAGLGFISSFLGVHLNVQDILCIEANPQLAPFIRQTHALNAVTAELATGVATPNDEHDTLPFYVRDPFWASSLTSKNPYSHVIEVPSLPLSSILKARRATALIVDIEGGEQSLFEGLDPGPVQKIYLELHTRYIGQRGIKKCFDDLSALGFWYDQRVSSGGSVLFRRLA